jgi:hypothetical protein
MCPLSARCPHGVRMVSAILSAECPQFCPQSVRSVSAKICPQSANLSALSVRKLLLLSALTAITFVCKLEIDRHFPQPTSHRNRPPYHQDSSNTRRIDQQQPQQQQPPSLSDVAPPNQLLLPPNCLTMLYTIGVGAEAITVEGSIG